MIIAEKDERFNYKIVTHFCSSAIPKRDVNKKNAKSFVRIIVDKFAAKI